MKTILPLGQKGASLGCSSGVFDKQGISAMKIVSLVMSAFFAVLSTAAFIVVLSTVGLLTVLSAAGAAESPKADRSS